MRLMVKRDKKHLLQIFTFMFLFSGILSTFFVSVSAFGNQRNYSESANWLSPDDWAVKMYRWDPYVEYGVHQWIADSALRFLWEKGGEYRERIRWLYDPDLDISFKNLFGVSLKPKWYDPDHCLDYYKGESRALNYKRWTHMRRYLQFMYGSYLPDLMGGKYSKIKAQEMDSSNTPIILNPSEIIKHKITLSIPRQSVKIMEASENKPIEFEHTKALTSIQNALEITKRALANDLERESINSIVFRPKTELAAQALGVIAHLIGDLAHPSHVYPHEGWRGDSCEWYGVLENGKIIPFSTSDEAYEYINENLLGPNSYEAKHIVKVETNLDKKTLKWFDLYFIAEVGNGYEKSILGGPNWQLLNPYNDHKCKHIANLQQNDYQSIIKKMILQNFKGGKTDRYSDYGFSVIKGGKCSTTNDEIDIINGRIDDQGNPLDDDFTKEVFKRTISRAVYYTAVIFDKICKRIDLCNGMKQDMKNWNDYSLEDVYSQAGMIKYDDQGRADLRHSFATKEEALKFCAENDLYGISEINDWADLDNLDPNMQKVVKVPLEDGRKVYYSVDMDAVILLPTGGVIAMGTYYASEEEYEKAREAIEEGDF